MTNSYDSAIRDVELIKDILLRTTESFIRFSIFFIWLAGYYSVYFTICVIPIVTSKLLLSPFVDITSIAYLLMDIVMVFPFIFYWKKANNEGNFLSVNLIKIWGYSLIMSKVLILIVIKVSFQIISAGGGEHFEIIPLTTIWIMVLTISICIFATGLLLQVSYIKILSFIYFGAHFFCYIIPSVKLPLGNEQVISLSISQSYIYLLTSLTLIILYVLVKKREKNNGTKLDK